MLNPGSFDEKIVFITGTDTGVGKTTVSVLLASYLREKGIDFRVIKPIETGCEVTSTGETIASDAVLLWKASGQKQSLDEITPWKFLAPLAPQMAAQETGTQIEPETLTKKIKAQAQLCDILLVEGAGGLLVPIAHGYTFGDLVDACNMAVLVVVGSRLGAINHAALTFEVLRHRQLSVLGYVLNDFFARDGKTAEKDFEIQKEAINTNRELLKSIGSYYGIQEMCSLPYLKDVASLEWPLDGRVEKEVAKLGEAIVKFTGLPQSK